MKIGGKYNWIGQHERLVYLGDNFSGNGYWHQFAKVEAPTVVWCELKGCDLHMIERTPHDEADDWCDVPPLGWRCTRGKGHEGPCAAVECPEDIELVAKGMDRLRETPNDQAKRRPAP